MSERNGLSLIHSILFAGNRSTRAGFLLLSVISLVFLFSATIEAREKQPEVIADTIVAEALLVKPAPATSIEANDLDNDGGGAVILSWDKSIDDHDGGVVAGYSVYRSASTAGPFEKLGELPRDADSFQDNKTVDGVEYFYRVDAFSSSGPNGIVQRSSSQSQITGAVKSKPQWFNGGRVWVLVFVILVSGSIIGYIRKAKKGEEIYVRKIAGISAVDEAVGRATEMGRKIFFIPGIQDMNDVQTIAGIAILGRVAALAAEYETWLEVPVSKSLVMVTARETMKEAYTSVGRPDNFQEAQVHYLTDDQFGYAAAIDGMVVREKPATIFYMGAFFAESLILAETGNAAGAIQIAGTAMPSQLPFFVAACDYTLIGEELFAASAYLSREPMQLGSLKGQDVGKAIFLVAITLGVLTATIGQFVSLPDWMDLSQMFSVQ